MFLKQYNYKPRSGSQGEAAAAANASAASTTAAPANNAASTDTSAAAMASNRRRSSTTEKFAGLSAHKRGSDPNSTDRKASFADQKPGGAGGIIGGMWSSFTKGS